MNITIGLTKVEYEMLKELQKRDRRYKKVYLIVLKFIVLCLKYSKFS